MYFVALKVVLQMLSCHLGQEGSGDGGMESWCEHGCDIFVWGSFCQCWFSFFWQWKCCCCWQWHCGFGVYLLHYVVAIFLWNSGLWLLVLDWHDISGNTVGWMTMRVIGTNIFIGSMPPPSFISAFVSISISIDHAELLHPFLFILFTVCCPPNSLSLHLLKKQIIWKIVDANFVGESCLHIEHTIKALGVCDIWQH